MNLMVFRREKNVVITPKSLAGGLTKYFFMFPPNPGEMILTT